MLYILLIVFHLFLNANSCEIRKTKLWYSYDVFSNTLAAHYQTTIPALKYMNMTALKCPTGWTLFSRGSYNWCLLIVQNTVYNQIDAEKDCFKRGGTLSGFQNENERLAVSNSAVALELSGQYIMIGAVTTADCTQNQLSNASAYSWTDGYTTGTSGMNWTVGNPDCSGFCVVMVITGTATGTLNDITCDVGDQNVISGYVCGQIASVQ